MRLTVFGSCRQDALYEHYDVTSIRNRLTYPHYSKEIVQAIEFCKGMALIPEHLTQQAFRSGILEKRKIDANEFMQEFAETDLFVVEIASRICYTYKGVYVHHILTDEQYGFHDRAAIQIRDLTDEEIETDLLRMRELLSPKPFLVVTHISTRSEGKRHELVQLLKRLGQKHGIPVLDPIEALAPLPTIAPLFQQETVLSHYTDFGRKMIGDAYKARITELLSTTGEGALKEQPTKPVSPMGLEALRVYESVYPKKRIGSSGDGGYVVADISGYDGLISCGISDNIDFERAFLQEHPVPCLAFDGTVAGLPPGPKSNILFYKLNVCHKNGEKTTNLHREMEAFHDAFLKMDIETYEFRWLHSLSQEQLQRFKQIVIEFHFPFTIHPHAGLDFQIPVAQKLAALEKLAATHQLIHIESNDATITQADIFTCTYIRKDVPKCPFKYTAVIVEPRKHRALSFVLQNFLENLSNEWGFIIFHGTSNKEYIDDILNNDMPQYKHRVYKLISLNKENLTAEEYNDYIKTNDFYDNIDTETLLIFQTDSLIIKEYKNIINMFLQYDYVGAPWDFWKQVGNGGLSLRKKNKMCQIINTVTPDKYPPKYYHEDWFFCIHNQQVPMNRPSFDLAKLFAVETIFHEPTFGVHAYWKFLKSEQIKYFENKYPDLAKLRELNSPTKKTAVLVWKQSYYNRESNHFWGLGDLLRGICATHMICSQLGYTLLVDMSQHPIGELVEPMDGVEQYKDEILKRAGGIPFECAADLGELERYLSGAFATTDTIYFNTNGPPMQGQEFPEATKQFVQNLLRPKPEMQAYFDARMWNTSSYPVLHMRLGDKAGLTAEGGLSGLLEGFRTIPPAAAEVFQRNYVAGDIFLCDCKLFKTFVRNLQTGTRMFDTTPAHIGTSRGGQELIETFFEFLVATRAAKIKTYSVYEWVSGFVNIANKVFDVPLEVVG